MDLFYDRINFVYTVTSSRIDKFSPYDLCTQRFGCVLLEIYIRQVSCVLHCFRFPSYRFGYTSNKILYMLFDSSCYLHKGKLLTVAICSSMLSDWFFLLEWRITFSSLRLVYLHISLYIKKGLLCWKGIWHSGKTLFSKKVCRGEL